MRFALAALLFASCSTQVDAGGCPWDDDEIQLNFALAREWVRFELAEDPGPVPASTEVVCWADLPPGISGQQRGHRLVVLPSKRAAEGALIHEAAHLLLDEKVGDPDRDHERELWMDEGYWRGCGGLL